MNRQRLYRIKPLFRPNSGIISRERLYGKFALVSLQKHFANIGFPNCVSIKTTRRYLSTHNYCGLCRVFQGFENPTKFFGEFLRWLNAIPTYQAFCDSVVFDDKIRSLHFLV